MITLRPRRIVFAAATCAAASAFPAAYAENLIFDSELAYAHEDNVGRAARAVDAADDDIASARVATTWLKPLTETAGLSATGAAEYQRFLTWSDLSHWQFSGQLAYRYKPNPAFDAVWYELELAGAIREFAASRIRDGARLTAGAALGRDLTAQLQLRVGYRYTADRAWHQAVFDTDLHRFYLNGEWRRGRATWYGGAGWQTGDTQSTAADNDRIEAVASADAPDPALSTTSRPRIAYRLDADTITTTLGCNFALQPNLALDVAALYFDADSATGAHYVGYRVSVRVLYRF